MLVNWLLPLCEVDCGCYNYAHMDNTSDGEVRSERAPRKRARATRETVKKRAVSDGRAVKAVTKKVVEVPIEEKKTIAAPPVRKAPTPLSAEQKSRRKKRRQAGVVVAILLLGVGSSAAVGFQDKGVIDVNQTINERNQKNQSSGNGNQDVIPVQNTNKAPNGGLKGLGIGSASSKPEPEEEEIATATTSDAVASSTEGTLEDEVTDLEEGQ